MFGPSPLGAATTASADLCRPFPTTCDAASTRQDGSSPRVRRATFVPYTHRIYGRTFRVISGFGLFGSLAQMRTPHAMSVRQTGTLPTASFRSPLAVRLAVPITRVRGGLPPPRQRSDTTPTTSRQSRRCAPCLAHQKGERRDRRSPSASRGDGHDRQGEIRSATEARC